MNKQVIDSISMCFVGFTLELDDNLTADQREAALKNIRWMLGCFEHLVHSNYDDGVPRKVEASQMIAQSVLRMKPKLTEEEYSEMVLCLPYSVKIIVNTIELL